MYSPILIIVYNRIDHLKKSINSLKKNPESRESVLYISSDGWKNQSDKLKILKIREYIKTINGFRSVNLISYTNNLGGDEATNKSRKIIFSKYKKLIVIEDDNEVSPLFLNFMNTALSFYQGNSSVFSISGYSPYTLQGNFPDENFLFKNHLWNPWGFGLWKDKYEAYIDFRNSKNLNECIDEDLKNKNFINKLDELSPEFYPHLLYSKIEKIKPEFDYCAGYYCLRNDFYNIFPTQTFVINNGIDGSGQRIKNIKSIMLKMSPEVLSINLPRFKKVYELNYENNFLKYSNNVVLISIKIVLIRLRLFKKIKKLYKSIKILI